MPLKFDLTGFEMLFTANYNRLCVVSFRIVQNKEVAEKIVGEVFYQLWRDKDLPGQEQLLKDYLTEFALNISISYLKKNNREFYAILKQKEEAVAETWQEGTDWALRGVRKRVDEAIAALSDLRRCIFVLNRFHKYNYHKIAHMIGVSHRMVEVQMSCALTELKNYLII